MRLSISSWSFHRELPTYRDTDPREGLDLFGFVRLCASRYGVEGVEIVSTHVMRPNDEPYVADLRGCIREAGLELVNLACDAGKVGLADPAERKENLEALRRWVETATSLDSDAIRVNCAAADGRGADEALEAAVADYRVLLAAVKDHGLALLLENHGGLTSDPDMCRRILEGVGDPAFRACPDNGNFAPEVREAGLAAMRPFMALAHLKTLAFDDAGNETTFDIPGIVAAYRDAGFDGFLSIEFEGKGDQYEGVAKSVAIGRRAIDA